MEGSKSDERSPRLTERVGVVQALAIDPTIQQCILRWFSQSLC